MSGRIPAYVNIEIYFLVSNLFVNEGIVTMDFAFGGIDENYTQILVSDNLHFNVFYQNQEVIVFKLK
ncbi:MAG: hypothetical protein ACXAC7_24360, partial [Candidatus Hodarchaeales archaeon]|jgi:hypothetical protein